MATREPVRCIVTKSEGYLVLVTPDDPATAPPAIKLGRWVPKRDLNVGVKGTLTWHASASRGDWYFAADPS